ncbi:predicted protein [Histoplasma capsulatum var. duboisii H88]|uniref:Predicted protein n=1 Tax=Ajellomyces capsulatus (strain H88) TaxID=544711 RepID=F0ULS2_AJEC8|nr:predicted protein [Histoplasma capsulatum var. duboisii H88]
MANLHMHLVWARLQQAEDHLDSRREEHRQPAGPQPSLKRAIQSMIIEMVKSAWSWKTSKTEIQKQWWFHGLQKSYRGVMAGYGPATSRRRQTYTHIEVWRSASQCRDKFRCWTDGGEEGDRGKVRVLGAEEGGRAG